MHHGIACILLLALLVAVPAKAEGEHVLSLRMGGGFFIASNERRDIPDLGGGLFSTSASSGELPAFSAGPSLAYEYRVTPKHALGLIAEWWLTATPLSAQQSVDTKTILEAFATWRYSFTSDRAGGTSLLVGVGAGERGFHLEAFDHGDVLLTGKVQLSHLFALSDEWAFSVNLDVNGGLDLGSSMSYVQPGLSVGVHWGRFR